MAKAVAARQFGADDGLLTLDNLLDPALDFKIINDMEKAQK